MKYLIEKIIYYTDNQIYNNIEVKMVMCILMRLSWDNNNMAQ